jgi:hypothetical protein
LSFSGDETEPDAEEAGLARGQSRTAAAGPDDAPRLRPRRGIARHQEARLGVRQSEGVASEYFFSQNIFFWRWKCDNTAG